MADERLEAKITQLLADKDMLRSSLPDPEKLKENIREELQRELRQNKDHIKDELSRELKERKKGEKDKLKALQEQNHEIDSSLAETERKVDALMAQLNDKGNKKSEQQLKKYVQQQVDELMRSQEEIFRRLD